MAKKTDLIKKLLTGASALAIFAAGASTAQASATFTSTNQAVTLSTTGNTNTNNPGAGLNWTDGSDLTIHAANVAVTTGSNLVFGENANGSSGINAAANAGVVFNIAHDVTQNAVFAFGTANGGLTTTNVSGGISTFLQDFGGDINATGGTITVARDVLAGASNGDVTVNGVNATVNVGQTVTRDVIVQNGTFNMGTAVAGGTAGGNIGRNLDVVGGTVNIGTNGNATNVTGNVTITGGTTTLFGKVTQDVNYTNGTASITGNVGNDVIFAGANDGLTIIGNVGRDINFGNKDGTLTYAGTVTGEVVSGGVGVGTIKIVGDSTFDDQVGNANAIKAIEIGKAGQAVTLALATDVVKAQTIAFKAGNADTFITNQGAAGDLTITGDIKNTSGANNFGNIKFVEDNAMIVVGTIGTDAASVNQLDFDTRNQDFDVEGDGLYVNEIKHGANDGAANARGKLTVRAAQAPANNNFVISTSTAGDKWLAELNIDSIAAGQVTKATLAAGKKIQAANVALAAGQNHTLTLEEGAKIISTTFNFNANDQVLNLKKDSSLTGNVVSVGGAGKGIINIKGDVTITDVDVAGRGIGNANAINKINIEGESALTLANATAKANADTALYKTANGINFTADGVLNIGKTGGGKVNVTFESAITNAETNTGTININALYTAAQAITFAKIGDPAGPNLKSLKKLNNSSDAKIVLNGASNIDTLHLEKNSIVQIANANANNIIGQLTNASAGQGTLDIIADTTLNINSGEDITPSTLNVLDFSVNNRTLTLTDGSRIKASNLANAANGTINFNGAGTLDIGTYDAALTKLELTGDNTKIVTVGGNAKLAALDLGANAGVAKFTGQTITITAVANAGTVELASTATQTVNGAIGPNAKVKFSGQNVTLADQVTAQNFEFTSEDAIEVTFADNQTDLNAANFVNTADKLNTVIFKTNAADFAGNLGGEQALIFRADGVDFTVSSDKAANAQFEATSNDKKFTIAGNAAQIGSIGTANSKFGTTEFNISSTINGDVYSNTISVANDRVATFNGGVSSTTINLIDENAKVVFAKDGLELGANIVNTQGNTGKGLVEFGKINALVNGDIGAAGQKVKSTSFGTADSAGKIIKLAGDVHSNDVIIGAGTLRANVEQVTLDGNTTVTGGTLDLGANKLISSGGNLTFTGNTTVSADFNGTTGGVIENAAGTEIHVPGTVTFQVRDLTTGIQRDETSFTILSNKGEQVSEEVQKALAANPVKITGGSNEFVKWVVSVADNGSVTLKRTNNAAAVFTEKLKVVGTADNTNRNANIVKLIGAAKGTAAGGYVDELTQMSNVKIAESLDRVASTADNVSNQAIENNNQLIGARLYTPNVASDMGGVMSPDQTTGVASGENENERYGIWGSPFYMNNTQKMRKSSPGYKSEGYGFTAGFDAKVNDDLVLGAAFTYANTDVKHKDVKVGDKTDIDTMLFSIYGIQQLTSNWYLQGVATAGSNSVKTRAIRVNSNTTTQTAVGKYDSMSFAGELLAGYNFKMDQLVITPMAGARFTRVNDGSYKESGTTNQNLDINKKAANKFEAIAGVRVSGSELDVNGVLLTPEVHGFVNHDLINKNPEVNVRIDGVQAPLSDNSAKSIRTFYNVGFGISTQYGMMEYGATYDATLATKYTGHQGSLKIRVNF